MRARGAALGDLADRGGRDVDTALTRDELGFSEISIDRALACGVDDGGFS